MASYEESNEVEIRYVDYGGYKRVKVDVLRQIRWVSTPQTCTLCVCQGVWDFCRAGLVLPSLGHGLTLSAAYSGLAEPDRDRLHCSPLLEGLVLWQRSLEYPWAEVGQASLWELDARNPSEVSLQSGMLEAAACCPSCMPLLGFILGLVRTQC